MATTTVESLGGWSRHRLEIVGILSSHGRVQEREEEEWLCGRCFSEFESLGRVIFSASSSLERIGFSGFAYSGVVGVRFTNFVC